MNKIRLKTLKIITCRIKIYNYDFLYLNRNYIFIMKFKYVLKRTLFLYIKINTDHFDLVIQYRR